MNPQVARMWADALDSGKYKQAYGSLARVNINSGERSYCCLGVLCMLYMDAGLELSVYHDTDTGQLRFNGVCGRLPAEVWRWAETGDNPWIGESNAINRNDVLTQPFPEIAAAIREHLVGVAA